MITLAQAFQAAGGRWLKNPLPDTTPLQGGAFDTRRLGQAHIFFALKGEAADGHDHLGRLTGSAVRLAVVHRENLPPGFLEGFGGAVMLVEDTLRALGLLGRAMVDKYRPRVVAVTGSYGKTTAKEVISHVLAGQHRVLKTPGSLNNEIGLPITLLDLDGSQDTAVLEFAARHVGDIDLLGAIAPPDVAVLMNVGRAHIGVFGSQEAIYRAKGEIFNHLRPGGLAVVLAEDAKLALLAYQAPLDLPPRVATFGLETGDYQACGVTRDPLGCQRFTGVHGTARLDFVSAIPGPHGLYPILAAWAVARELGVADEETARRAAVHPQQKGRAQLKRTPMGALLVDDTYNASPETVVNLIRTLEGMEGTNRVLVLGHLSEQDDWEAQALETIGASLKPPITLCLVHDPAAPQTADRLEDAVQRAGSSCRVEGHPDFDDLLAALRKLDRAGTLIGIKGSRSAHLERVVLALEGRLVQCPKPSCGLLIHCADCHRL